jgi:pantoate--beta-alanine ligase
MMRPTVSDHRSAPVVCGNPQIARDWVHAKITASERVALVPTMGALHAGHLELVRNAKLLADHVVVSIFVNPTQFGPGEDYQRYPRTFDDDLQALEQEAVAMVFAPTGPEMYSDRFSTYVSPPAVSEPLEGKFRPEHFRGVCTVVLKLFNIIPAQVAVFGQKDYQQARVIEDMVRDLDLPVTLAVMPTVREPDGLAMSSRNRYLNPVERMKALAISQSLRRAAELYAGGQRSAAELESAIQETLQDAAVERIDYAAVVDPVTLLPFDRDIPLERKTDSGLPPTPVAVALIAAHVGSTRLIDNLLLT